MNKDKPQSFVGTFFAVSSENNSVADISTAQTLGGLQCWLIFPLAQTFWHRLRW